MNLETQDIRRFYRIWMQLLDYTNKKCKVAQNIGKLSDKKTVNAEEIYPIRERLWQDDSVLDECIAKNPFDFSKEDLTLISSWKNRVADNFFVMKNLKYYSVFLGKNALYGVHGITDPFSEMIPPSLPVMVGTVLIPFEGRIIYDSLFSSYPIRFGSGIKKNLLDDYRRIKNQSGIITSLD